uniref:Uncharacterized protein n=1 Tax=Zea mays TaxID=4577 RepID=B4FNP6_MAIZE|nr:unknown [Zea mays]
MLRMPQRRSLHRLLMWICMLPIFLLGSISSGIGTKSWECANFVLNLFCILLQFVTGTLPVTAA